MHVLQKHILSLVMDWFNSVKDYPDTFRILIVISISQSGRKNNVQFYASQRKLAEIRSNVNVFATTWAHNISSLF